ncbi:MAG: nucleoside deaminase [Bacteroidales bacterium]
MTTNKDLVFLKHAIEIAHKNIQKNGGPFGAVITENDAIIAESGNNVRIINDPTAHAEIEAIRKACKNKNTYSLENCTIYSSCEPCPMCLSAIYWARISRVVFSSSKTDASDAGFDDNFIYKEIQKPIEERFIPTYQIKTIESKIVFDLWKNDKNSYMY